MGKLKDVGLVGMGILILVALIALAASILMGLGEFSLWALDFLPYVFGWSVVASVLMIPLAIIPATRGWASAGYTFVSFAFGATLWLLCLAFTYVTWGLLPVILGLMFFGVGVAVIGTIAALFTGAWTVLGNIVVMFALTFGLRALGFWLSEKHEERRNRLAARQRPSVAIIDHDA